MKLQSFSKIRASEAMRGFWFPLKFYPIRLQIKDFKIDNKKTKNNKTNRENIKLCRNVSDKSLLC